VRRNDHDELSEEFTTFKERVNNTEKFVESSVGLISNSKYSENITKAEMDEAILSMSKKLKSVKQSRARGKFHNFYFLDGISDQDIAKLHQTDDKIQEFQEKIVKFQIDMKTIEKCLKEDISSLNT